MTVGSEAFADGQGSAVSIIEAAQLDTVDTTRSGELCRRLTGYWSWTSLAVCVDGSH